MRSILALAVVLAISGTVQAADPTFPSSAGKLAVHTVAQGLSHPWSLAFLPDGRMLVTERPGRIRIVDLTQTLRPSTPVIQLPPMFAPLLIGELFGSVDWVSPTRGPTVRKRKPPIRPLRPVARRLWNSSSRSSRKT